jgi:hypothetical protein
MNDQEANQETGDWQEFFEILHRLSTYIGNCEVVLPSGIYKEFEDDMRSTRPMRDPNDVLVYQGPTGTVFIRNIRTLLDMVASKDAHINTLRSTIEATVAEKEVLEKRVKDLEFALNEIKLIAELRTEHTIADFCKNALGG